MAPRKKSPSGKMSEEEFDAVVERLKKNTTPKSKQPRFAAGQKEGVEDIFSTVYPFIKSEIQKEPPLELDSRERSAWLMRVVHLEPNLEGVFTTVCQIDQNRGWSLIGAEEQVGKFLPVFHGFEAAPGICGWRYGMSVEAQSFYGTDIGAVVEVGKEGEKEESALAALLSVDPTMCRLMKSTEKPMRYYYPKGVVTDGKRRLFEDWEKNAYFRVTSMVSPVEALRGLGRCAVSHCIELAKIMVAIYEYDNEQLGSRAPKGIMTIHGVSEEQWERTLKARDTKLDSLQREYYGGVQVLASAGVDQIDVKLTALSNLPDNFNQKIFTDLLMYSYALCFGYDPREFWPVSGGTLGTGHETEMQHRKAMSKGRMENALSFQEALQLELPESLHFGFEQQDLSGEVLEAEAKSAKLAIIKDMFMASNGEQSMISWEQAQVMLAEAGLIPREWVAAADDVEGTDLDDKGEDKNEPVVPGAKKTAAMPAQPEVKKPEPVIQQIIKPIVDKKKAEEQKERILSMPEVRRALQDYPMKPIVRYRWPESQVEVLFQNAAEALSRDRFYSTPMVTRTKKDGILYKAGGIVVTSKDALIAIEEARQRVGDDIADAMTGKAETIIKE